MFLFGGLAVRRRPRPQHRDLLKLLDTAAHPLGIVAIASNSSSWSAHIWHMIM